MTDQTVISVSNLTRRFGDFTAVDTINFTVNKGEIFGFLGPNGSGKTTTIRMLLGLLRPTSGTIRILDKVIDGNASKIRQQVGYMSQRFSLYNDLTVLQNLNFYGKAYGLTNANLQLRIQEAMIMAGLKGHEHEKTKDLSGGWRQRLALSAAILHRPEVIFLDEPTAGVDPVSRRAFWDLLYQLITEGITVFVTTHYMDEAEHCHHLAFIQRGVIIANGSPAQIKTQRFQGQVLEIDTSQPVEAVKVLQKVSETGDIPLEEVELYGSLIHVVARNVQQYRYPITKALREAGIHPDSMSIIEPSLEDVFIACMKAK